MACTRLVTVAVGVIALGVVVGEPAMAGSPDDSNDRRPSVLDLDGQTVDPLQATAGTVATVFLFTTINCPVSNRYAPEVRRLHREFGGRGVRFVLVYANPKDEPSAVRAHLRRFDYSMNALRDPGHELVRFAGVTVTPEAAVFDPAGRLVYRGRIDDRQVDFGVDRPAPTSRDLQAALLAALEGRPAPRVETRAVGCFLADLVR